MVVTIHPLRLLPASVCYTQDSADSSGPTVLKDTTQDPRQVELSNVDLGREAVSQIIAQRRFEANLRTLKAADAMLGSILDTKK
ncbi:MAG TPA: flagellar basal body rod C-terminal domain-containing protein [Nitrospira sp.]|nr:flagellar basal body rod C-terminal domain-containing protein [Nitrospira sp.]